MDPVPAFPDLSDHELVEQKDVVRGPTDATLLAHRNSRALLYVGQSNYFDLDQVAPAIPHAAFELAVFEDGTLAFEGHRCVGKKGLAFRALSAERLASLRASVIRQCLGMRGSHDDCSHSDTVHLSCQDGHRKNDVVFRCDDPPTTAFVERVVRALGIEAWVLADWACPRVESGAAATGEISRTIWPVKTRVQRYAPR